VYSGLIGLETFNIVIVGAFQVHEIDYTDFDFHGQRLVERLRVPPLVQAGTGEYTVDLIPGRFQVAAGSSKATEYRVAPMIAAANRFVDDYVGRRSVQLVGHNFAGSFAPGSEQGGDDFVHALLAIERLQAAVGRDIPLLRESITLTWQATDDARGTLRLEPLRSDPTRVFYDLNFTIGADALPGQPPSPLEVPVDSAIAAFQQSHDAGTALLNSLVGGSA
jgi:hypothetical protein